MGDVIDMNPRKTATEKKPKVRKLAASLGYDGTGQSSILATPEWWRALPDAPNLRELCEQVAAHGEAHIDNALCLVTGATTGRPCLFPRDECPHHGESSDKHRCGVIGKNQRPCRWNLTARGPCPNHSPGMPHPRRATHPPGKRKPPAPVVVGVKPIEVVCPHCQAKPGAKCRYPNGSETSTHRKRRQAAKTTPPQDH